MGTAAAVRRNLVERTSQCLVEHRHICGVLLGRREDGIDASMTMSMASQRVGRILVHTLRVIWTHRLLLLVLLALLLLLRVMSVVTAAGL